MKRELQHEKTTFEKGSLGDEEVISAKACWSIYFAKMPFGNKNHLFTFSQMDKDTEAVFDVNL
ncbi:MAG: hypothetical protein VKJ04_11425 [Vampirovibrionales bacterium]|nr:hypothetical protein [Vampirovibrionales bacterium]